MEKLSFQGLSNSVLKKLPRVDIPELRSIASNIAQYQEPLGKHSILFDYCNGAIRRGHSEFVIVCVDNVGGAVAFDNNSQDPRSPAEMRDVRSWYYARQGYWRRILRQKIELDPVDMTVVGIDRSNRIRVKSAPVNYWAIYTKIEQEIQEIDMETSKVGDKLPLCGVAHNGEISHDLDCGDYDEYENRLCLLEQKWVLKGD